MELVWTLIVGLLIGAVAKIIMPGRDPGGIIVTMIVGIAGALVAGYLGEFAGIYQVGESAGFLASVLGAMLLLFVYRRLSDRRSA